MKFHTIYSLEDAYYQKAVECHDSKEYQEGWAIAKGTTLRHMQIVEGFSIE